MELKVLNSSNKVTGKETVDDAIFKAKFKPFLLHDYVVMQRRAIRQGTHSTKTRAEVSGTGKKPFKQKGTGHARQGTLIGPHQPGGGIQFGPKPRDYSTKLNRQTKQEAIRVALSEKNHEGKLAILESFEIASGKSKEAFKILSTISPVSALVIGEFSEATLRSVRNLANYKTIPPTALNVIDILNHDQVLIDRKALESIQTRYGKTSAKTSATEKGAAKAKATKKKVAA